jgi:hypothetical protein
VKGLGEKGVVSCRQSKGALSNITSFEKLMTGVFKSANPISD